MRGRGGLAGDHIDTVDADDGEHPHVGAVANPQVVLVSRLAGDPAPAELAIGRKYLVLRTVVHLDLRGTGARLRLMRGDRHCEREAGGGEAVFARPEVAGSVHGSITLCDGDSNLYT